MTLVAFFVAEEEEEDEKERAHVRRDDGGDRETAGSLYPGQAARERVAGSGGTKPKQTTHRQRFYIVKHGGELIRCSLSSVFSPCSARSVCKVVSNSRKAEQSPGQFAAP
jgi:hypothetical protein